MTGERPTAAIVDLDGTVVSGRAVIDGLDALRAAGLPVVFLTNRATDAPNDHAAVLRDGGIDAVAPDVVTAADIAADHLSASDGPALVLGETPAC